MGLPDTWIELDVCSTCERAVAGVLEIHEDYDLRSADAIDRWAEGFHLWVDCSGDGCEATHWHICEQPGSYCDRAGVDGEEVPCSDGHHAGGFTWRSCDLCGTTGRDSARVYAEPQYPGNTAPGTGWGPEHEITASSLRVGDEVTWTVDGIAGIVRSIDFGYSVYARVGDGYDYRHNYLSAGLQERVRARFYYS